MRAAGPSRRQVPPPWPPSPERSAAAGVGISRSDSEGAGSSPGLLRRGCIAGGDRAERLCHRRGCADKAPAHSSLALSLSAAPQQPPEPRATASVSGAR